MPLVPGYWFDNGLRLVSGGNRYLDEYDYLRKKKPFTRNWSLMK